MQLAINLGEGTVLVLVALVVAYVMLVYLRRRTIAGDEVLVLCAVRPVDSRWRPVLARYGTTTLELFTIGGLSLRPVRVLHRSVGNLGSVTSLPRDEWPPLMDDPMVLRCIEDGDEFDLAVGRAHYPAIRSWFESSPPATRLSV